MRSSAGGGPAAPPHAGSGPRPSGGGVGNASKRLFGAAGIWYCGRGVPPAPGGKNGAIQRGGGAFISNGDGGRRGRRAAGQRRRPRTPRALHLQALCRLQHALAPHGSLGGQPAAAAAAAGGGAPRSRGAGGGVGAGPRRRPTTSTTTTTIFTELVRRTDRARQQGGARRLTIWCSGRRAE